MTSGSCRISEVACTRILTESFQLYHLLKYQNLLPTPLKYHANIQAIDMKTCFALMLGCYKYLPLEFEAKHITNTDLSWLAVNNHKSGRSNIFTLMANSSKTYEKEHIDADRKAVMHALCSETSRTIGHDVSVADYKIIYV